MNIRRIIKEELLKEAGGYDDLNIMGLHAGHVMDTLSNTYNDLTNTLQGLANAIVDGSSKTDLAGYLTEASNEMDTLIDVIKNSSILSIVFLYSSRINIAPSNFHV